jgi:hypothetical protein
VHWRARSAQSHVACHVARARCAVVVVESALRGLENLHLAQRWWLRAE